MKKKLLIGLSFISGLAYAQDAPISVSSKLDRTPLEKQSSEAAPAKSDKIPYKQFATPKIRQYFLEVQDHDLSGKPVEFHLDDYRYVLVVNTASKCGLVDQLKDLEQMHQQFGHQLLVVGVPTLDYQKQEFDTNSAIAEFCQKNYGVSFLMLTLNSVDSPHEKSLFAMLFKQLQLDRPSWNYQKFLFDLDAENVKVIEPKQRLHPNDFKKLLTQE